MLNIIRYGELHASNFTLGPWSEPTRSALGCRPLLEGNPFITEATPVYASMQVKGETAAYVHLHPDQFICHSAEHPETLNWLWMTDYRSLPAYRNSGAGVLLIQRLRQQLESEGYCLGGINMSADSQRVFEALRFPVFEKIPRYVFPLRSRPILARYRLLRPILPLACPAANLALRLYFKRAIHRIQTTDGGDVDSRQWTVDSENHPPSTPHSPPSTIHHPPSTMSRRSREARRRIPTPHAPHQHINTSTHQQKSPPKPTSLSALESSWFQPAEPISTFTKSPTRMHWLLNLPPGGNRILQPYLLHPSDQSDPSDLTGPIARLLLRNKPFKSIAGGRFRDLRILSVLEADSADPALLVRAVLEQATREQPPIDVIEWCEDRPAEQSCLQRAGFRQMGSMAFCASQSLPTPHHITQGDGDAGL